MKRELSFLVQTEVTIEYDNEKTNTKDAIANGMNLAFNSNFHTIINGTRLKLLWKGSPVMSKQTKKEHNIKS